MEVRNNKAVYYPEGNIQEEMKEISKMHEKAVYVYTMVTNTCSGFLTLICC